MAPWVIFVVVFTWQIIILFNIWLICVLGGQVTLGILTGVSLTIQGTLTTAILSDILL